MVFRLNRPLSLLAASVFGGCGVTSFSLLAAATEIPEPIDAFLEAHCYDCHDDSVQKGGLNLLDLGFDLSDPHVFESWVHVVDRAKAGEMPPKKKARPEKDQLASLLDTLQPQLYKTSAKQVKANGRVHSRRLTRREYEHTLHDMLGIDIPLVDLLPPDAATGIFETQAESQQLSHHLLERYLEVAEVALKEAFDRALKGDETFAKNLNGHQLGKEGWRGGNYRTLQDFADGRAISWPFRLQFYGRMAATTVPDDGWYRVTLKNVHAVNTDVIWGTLKSGACSSSAPVLYHIANIEATRKKRDLTYTAWIEGKSMLKLTPEDATTPRPDWSTKGGTVNFKGSDLIGDGTHGIALDGIHIERIYPYSDRERVSKILLGEGVDYDEVSQRSREKKKTFVNSRIRSFANRAFRRPVTSEQLAPYQKLAEQELAQRGSPRDALMSGYRAILCSPRFLTLYEPPGDLDQHALATRLSYMLWSSAPDWTLRQQADQGLLTGKGLDEAIDRLINHSRFDRFIASFSDQWLKLNEINFTTPDGRYRTFDPVVQASILEETRLYLRYLFRNDLPVSHLIQSDFAMLNERLYRFYRLDQVKDLEPNLKLGGGFQKVSLGNNPRGGLVTHASVLKVTADGSTTSPIIRGVYMNERILGRHIPPPPPGIPAVEPDIRGAVSIRDQLAKHSSSESCMGCHQKIDPAGYAFEVFDPTGLWRSRYGSSSKSAKVDPSGITPEGQPFETIAGWKAIHAKRPQVLTKTLAGHLLSYATGAEPTFSDRPHLNKIVETCSASDYGMRSILTEVIRSRPFQIK